MTSACKHTTFRVLCQILFTFAGFCTQYNSQLYFAVPGLPMGRISKKVLAMRLLRPQPIFGNHIDLFVPSVLASGSPPIGLAVVARFIARD
jgi:hypothetical protein